MRGILYFLSYLRYLSVVTTAPNLVMALAPLHQERFETNLLELFAHPKN